jgi:hypothetical protein
MQMTAVAFVWCGTFSDGEHWPRAFARLEGARVRSAALLRLDKEELPFEKDSRFIHIYPRSPALGPQAF